MDMQKKKITMATAARIRHFRQKNALSQEALALRANLNPAYFGQIERGVKCPTIDTLYKIASALDISLSELLRFEDDEPPKPEDHQEQLHALFQMTPYYWKTPKAGAERLCKLENLNCRFAFDIHVFAKN